METPHFVDKTMLIKEFFKPKRCGILISAPRKFGKSTNMDMLKRFCEIQADSEGKAIDTNRTENFIVFSKRYKKLNRLKYLHVYRYKTFFKKRFGKYPVIYLDFKSLSGKTFNNFLNSFRILIEEVYVSHEYLLKSHLLNERQKNTFKKFYDSDKVLNLNEEELQTSLRFLSKMLYLHFNKTVIVFIDEYDTPIQESIHQLGTKLNEIPSFISVFISIFLKSNPYIGRALLNSCTDMKRVVSTLANNVEVVPILGDNNYSKFYGISDKELQQLLKKFNVTDKMDDVRRRYDGYKLEKNNITLFNLYSIVSYLESSVKSGNVTYRQSLA